MCVRLALAKLLASVPCSRLGPSALCRSCPEPRSSVQRQGRLRSFLGFSFGAKVAHRVRTPASQGLVPLLSGGLMGALVIPALSLLASACPGRTWVSVHLKEGVQGERERSLLTSRR